MSFLRTFVRWCSTSGDLKRKDCPTKPISDDVRLERLRHKERTSFICANAASTPMINFVKGSRKRTIGSRRQKSPSARLGSSNLTLKAPCPTQSSSYETWVGNGVNCQRPCGRGSKDWCFRRDFRMTEKTVLEPP